MGVMIPVLIKPNGGKIYQIDTICYITAALPRPKTHRSPQFFIRMRDAKMPLVSETYKQTKPMIGVLEKRTGRPWNVLQIRSPNWSNSGVKVFRDLGQAHRFSEDGPPCLRENSANRFRVRDRHKIFAKSGIWSNTTYVTAGEIISAEYKFTDQFNFIQIPALPTIHT